MEATKRLKAVHGRLRRCKVYPGGDGSEERAHMVVMTASDKAYSGSISVWINVDEIEEGFVASGIPIAIPSFYYVGYI